MAMQACRRLRREGFACQMALNLSARNLVDDRCVQDIERQLRAHALSGPDIVVELTETAIMHDTTQVAELLDRLDRQGVGLALDDFGTGFSSLANLKRLPLDFLKVDGSFVRDMTTDEQDAIIVRSTITLAHNLGKKVIAEGVEDAAAERLLREMGCDIVQGYHLARPMPLDELIAWIHRHEAMRLSPEPLLLRS
jgi:EAL domain-containing protein (putative c-di-GMP-specific phosphodiesterase class I)